MFRDQILMDAAGSQTFTVPSQYRFVTIFNNTDRTISLYGGSLSETLSNRFSQISQYSSVTVPLPDTITRVKVKWGSGAAPDNLGIAFTEKPLPVNVSLAPPGGSSSVQVTNQPSVTLAADLVGLATQATLAAIAGHLARATTPTVYRVAVGGAEASQALPANTKRFTIRATGGAVEISFASGGNYFTIADGQAHTEADLDADAVTVYVRAGAAGPVAEIVAWT